MVDSIIARNGMLVLYGIDDINGYVVNIATGQKFEPHTIISTLSKGVWTLEPTHIISKSMRVKAMQPQIVAKRGTNSYLVAYGPKLAKIVNPNSKYVSKLLNIQSVLARGYWEEYTPNDNEDSKVMELL